MARGSKRADASLQAQRDAVVLAAVNVCAVETKRSSATARANAMVELLNLCESYKRSLGAT